MAEEILRFLERAASAISLVGAGVILAGFVHAAVRYAISAPRLGAPPAFSQFKVRLGRALMLGLEMLVVADVIETITVEPTFQSLGVLAFLVVVRTIVSWTLTLEIEGRWPWQASAEDHAHA